MQKQLHLFSLPWILPCNTGPVLAFPVGRTDIHYVQGSSGKEEEEERTMMVLVLSSRNTDGNLWLSAIALENQSNKGCRQVGALVLSSMWEGVSGCSSWHHTRHNEITTRSVTWKFKKKIAFHSETVWFSLYCISHDGSQGVFPWAMSPWQLPVLVPI